MARLPYAVEPSAFDRDPAIDALVDEIRALGALADPRIDSDDWLGKAIAEIARPIDEATRSRPCAAATTTRSRPRCCALLRRLRLALALEGLGREFRAATARRGDRAARRRCGRAWRAFATTPAPTWRRCCATSCGRSSSYYEEVKQRAGVLDFLDLLLVARDLVRDHAAVRAELQQRFTHIFVDEFQDTDPLQAEILLLLAADDPAETDWRRARPLPGKLFIVGDPKQSIYRFRRADVALYQGVKRPAARVRRRAGASDGELSRDARNPGDVNAAFAPLMPSESPTQPAYVAADAVSRGLPRRSRDGRAAGARALRRTRLRHQVSDRRIAARRGRRASCDGWSRRADGR